MKEDVIVIVIVVVPWILWGLNFFYKYSLKVETKFWKLDRHWNGGGTDLRANGQTFIEPWSN